MRSLPIDAPPEEHGELAISLLPYSGVTRLRDEELARLPRDEETAALESLLKSRSRPTAEALVHGRTEAWRVECVRPEGRAANVKHAKGTEVLGRTILNKLGATKKKKKPKR